MDALTILKLLVGIPFIFFLPGLSWSYLLFKRREVPVIERVGIAIGLSLALVPLAMFWLAWLLNVKITLVNAVLLTLALSAIPPAVIRLRSTRRFQQTATAIASRLPHSRDKVAPRA